MARTRGCLGKVKSGATPDLTGEVTEFSFDETAEVLDGSSMGSCTKTNVVGNVETTGSVAVWWDAADTGQDNFVVGSEIVVELYPEGDASGDVYFTGTALITGRSLSSSVGSIVSQTFTFSVQGSLTETTVAP